MPGRLLFILVKHKQPSLIFEGATRAYLSGAPNSLVPSNIKLEVDSHRDKCLSLLPRIVNYRKKGFKRLFHVSQSQHDQKTPHLSQT